MALLLKTRTSSNVVSPAPTSSVPTDPTISAPPLTVVRHQAAGAITGPVVADSMLPPLVTATPF